MCLKDILVTILKQTVQIYHCIKNVHPNLPVREKEICGKAVSFFKISVHHAQKRVVTVKQLNAQTTLYTLSISAPKPPADSLIALPAPAEQK